MQEKVGGNDHRSTMVYVDSYENRVLQGRIYNPRWSEVKQVSSLMDFLLKIEHVLDEKEGPRSFDRQRAFVNADTVRPSEDKNYGIEMGRIATFRVQIFSRQNADWQGNVRWLEGNSEESFRSTLELVLLMDSALRQADNSLLEDLLEDKHRSKGKKSQHPPVSSLSRKEYWHILRTAKQMGRKRPYLMIKTIVSAGIREKELQQLSIEALKQGSVWMPWHGGNRFIEIPEPLCSELLDYAEEQGIQTGLVFVSKNGSMKHTHIWKEIKQVCRAAGIPEEKGTPSSMYKLYQSTYHSVCSEGAENTQLLYQKLLEKEAPQIAWGEPEPNEFAST